MHCENEAMAFLVLRPAGHLDRLWAQGPGSTVRAPKEKAVTWSFSQGPIHVSAGYVPDRNLRLALDLSPRGIRASWGALGFHSSLRLSRAN